MIERTNGTFQRRLVNEFKLEDITSINDVNRYLTDIFIPDFNNRFAFNSNDLDFVMGNSPSEEKINLTLSTLSVRKIDNGSSIRYHNKVYQAYDSNMVLKCIKHTKDCLVIKTFNDELYVFVEDSVYKPVELNKHALRSNEYDVKLSVDMPQIKKVYIPAMCHPWKRSSFIAQQGNAHNFHHYGF